MHLCQFYLKNEIRLGVAVDEFVADVAGAHQSAIAEKNGVNIIPDDMIEFLKVGKPALKIASQVEGMVEKILKSGKKRPAYLHSLEKVRLAPPVRNPRKIICVGANYRDHCLESGMEIPKSPVIFAKFPTAIIGPDDHIVLPKASQKVDYEAELAFIIGKDGKDIPRDKAYQYVAGYTIFNDVSARDLQFSDGQWVRGKTPDTFAPIGPFLVTKEEVPNPHRLGISLSLNGEVMQRSNTNQIIFTVPNLVSFLSQVITLETGDIVSTGTPPGVGAFREPPVYLKPKDVIEVTIEKLGTLRNTVAKPK